MSKVTYVVPGVGFVKEVVTVEPVVDVESRLPHPRVATQGLELTLKIEPSESSDQATS